MATEVGAVQSCAFTVTVPPAELSLSDQSTILPELVLIGDAEEVDTFTEAFAKNLALSAVTVLVLVSATSPAVAVIDVPVLPPEVVVPVAPKLPLEMIMFPPAFKLPAPVYAPEPTTVMSPLEFVAWLAEIVTAPPQMSISPLIVVASSSVMFAVLPLLPSARYPRLVNAWIAEID